MIVVIGAGVAGLSLGWQLVKSGADIKIIDSMGAGSGASGAAGAYLEPRPGGGRLRELEWASLDMWPGFASELELASGMEMDFRNDGVIYATLPEQQHKSNQALERHRTSGWQVEYLEAEELRIREPALCKDVIAGYSLPQVCRTDAQKTCKALTVAFIRHGGELIENEKVERIDDLGGMMEIHAGQGILMQADKVVVASGIGTATIAGLPDDIPQCRPVRGTMVELKMQQQSPLVNNPVKCGNCVFLPMSGARLLVGSSHEEGKDHPEAGKQIVEQIVQQAARIIPGITNLPVIGERTGIRALVGDGLLRLGRRSINKNLYYSLSHAGAGYLRAPVIAQEFARKLLNSDYQSRWIDPFYENRAPIPCG